MKLIIATPSPFARKVRVILREKGIDCEEVIDIPWNKNTITDGLNPLGKIPILLSDGIEPVFDSKNIVEYLEQMRQEPRFHPENQSQKLKASLIETAADGVCDAVVLIFLENSRSRDLRSKAWIDRQKEKVYQGLRYLSDALSTEKYFIDAHFTIADIAVFCCLEYLDLRFPEFDWRNEHSNLDNFWQTHQSRQSFLETKPTAQVIEPLSE